MNKHRIAVMLLLIIIIFLYMIEVIQIDAITNFSLTLAALLFSISSVIDTFAKGNKVEENIRLFIDTIALGVALILPRLTNIEILETLMNSLDTNVLLLLSLFFTMAGQWSAEIKMKEIRKGK